MGNGAVVITAALPEPVALAVYADNGQYHGVQMLRADFSAAKLGNADFAASPMAFRFQAA